MAQGPSHRSAIAAAASAPETAERARRTRAHRHRGPARKLDL